MMGGLGRLGIVVRPSAWFWWITSIVSLLTLIVFSAIGAVAIFSGSSILFLRDWWSVLFWLTLWLPIGAFVVSVVGQFFAKRREVRAGYTTMPTEFKHVEWRDHATGLVLRQADEPTPLGPIKELRRAALAADDS